MGRQHAMAIETLDIGSVREHLRRLTASLQRAGARKQSFGQPIDSMRAKQALGRPVYSFGAKQSLGVPVYAGMGKHLAGFAIDVIRALNQIDTKVEVLGAKAGFARGELDTAGRFYQALDRCRDDKMDANAVRALFEEQVRMIYSDPKGSGM